MKLNLGGFEANQAGDAGSHAGQLRAMAGGAGGDAAVGRAVGDEVAANKVRPEECYGQPATTIKPVRSRAPTPIRLGEQQREDLHCRQIPSTRSTGFPDESPTPLQAIATEPVGRALLVTARLIDRGANAQPNPSRSAP